MSGTPETIAFRGATIVDGTGAEPFHGDVVTQGDRIAAVADHVRSRADLEIEAEGLVVAPGFINTLSWAGDELFLSGCASNHVRQGITLEVLGEGLSWGPANGNVATTLAELQPDGARYDITWETLDEFLGLLEHRGVCTNIASFVGATTLRLHAIGHTARPASSSEIDRMCELAGRALRDGALGVSSALIYPPGTAASTEELTALARVCREHDGVYVSHVRSEGDRLLEAVEEFLAILSASGVRGEIYHLKAVGERNWHKLEGVIEAISDAHAAGLSITAGMYPYIAGAATLDCVIPPQFHEGGRECLLSRLRDADTRRDVVREMREETTSWENMWLLADSPRNIRLGSFGDPELRQFSGKTVHEIASSWGCVPEEAAVELVVRDRARCRAIFTTQSEANVRQLLSIPWISFCTDSEGIREGDSVRLHPRAFGTFPRILGRYVREQSVLTMADAVRRMTSLPAETYGLVSRGRLEVGYFADIVAFDRETVNDCATFEHPHEYARGIEHVIVNGIRVVEHDRCLGARPGKVVRRGGGRNHGALA